uniref:Uncharacterized protein n=1 Tax=Anguilla anguilla TaxID=7936 RepID=A0A0E9UAX4_ANGAN
MRNEYICTAQNNINPAYLLKTRTREQIIRSVRSVPLLLVPD